MKPYGREKKIKGGGEWKTDAHFHPKHEIHNWWEDITKCLSRSTMKQRIKKSVKKEIEEIK